MNIPIPRIPGTRPREQIRCQIRTAQDEMARAQRIIIMGNKWVARIELDRFLYVGDPLLWFAEISERVAELVKGTGVISVKCDRRFQLDPRFGQSILTSAE